MNTYTVGRLAAVLAGGATLFGLQQGYEQPLYVALPAAIAVYVALRAGFALWERRGKSAG